MFITSFIDIALIALIYYSFIYADFEKTWFEDAGEQITIALLMSSVSVIF